MSAGRRAGRVPAAALLAAAMALPAAGPAAADGEKVRLPVMPARLDAGDPCTGGSKARATAVPWEQQNLQLARTWTFGRGAGVKVAVVDTGVSAQAPTLAGRVSAVGSAGADCVGHGTFVAGLIAAAPAKNVRVAGVAQESRIIAVRGTDERGAATAASVAAGIRAATDAGAKVVQVSPALAADSAGLASAVKYAASHDALIVAAATPDPARPSPGREPEPPRDYWPASAPGVLSVIDMDARGTRPDGAPATRGADLAAPGDGVVGVGPRGTGHFIGSGASFAAAYAAGTAALVRSAHPELSAAQTAQRLTRTAYPADVPRLDPYAAVTSVPDPVGRTEAVRDDSVVMPPGNGSGGATRRAVWIAVGGGSLALLVAWAALVAPRGRARGWRPAGRRPVAGTTGD
ncbi:S8 family serine peptidase [Streptomyces sp. NBC_01005]|uniref:S8 family serine peptidase n=1 Tax=unclassified Streptomyces TaxID=2593676 RepID=UPI002E37FA34|nr:S8 family serine peptidase [Streptomyces sp. NBC_01362]WSW09102.1 S8 family serine peptidase [Streptomyces sp. NBC_01005]WTC98608.1 S8 family serine peptidase [Streptomyces sp. NBC_01650]